MPSPPMPKKDSPRQERRSTFSIFSFPLQYLSPMALQRFMWKSSVYMFIELSFFKPYRIQASAGQKFFAKELHWGRKETVRQ